MRIVFRSSRIDLTAGTMLLIDVSSLGEDVGDIIQYSSIIHQNGAEFPYLTSPGVYHVLLSAVSLSVRGHSEAALQAGSVPAESFFIRAEDIERAVKEIPLPDQAFQVQLIASDGKPVAGRTFSIQSRGNADAVIEIGTGLDGTITLFGEPGDYPLLAPWEQKLGEQLRIVRL